MSSFLATLIVPLKASKVKHLHVSFDVVNLLPVIGGNMAAPTENPDGLLQDEGDRLRSEALAADVTQLPSGYYHSARVIGSFVGMGMSLMGTCFAFQGSAAAITSIGADIGLGQNSSLMGTVWTVGSSISLLLFGRLSDRFGRRNFLIGSNVLGTIGAIVACTAQTFNTLIVGQALLGLASGPPTSYPLLAGELMSNKTKYLGAVCVALPNVVATAFAPYFGQRLSAYASWRWIFYIYFILIGTEFFIT